MGRETILTLTKYGTQTNVLFGQGYWSFTLIQERLGEEGITLTANRHNNTCRIHAPKDADVNLGEIGPLLGFSADKSISAGSFSDSGVVNINLGLRYITIACSLVDSTRNKDRYGNNSDVIANIPVTTEESLNRTITNLGSQKFVAPLRNGSYSEITWDMGDNTKGVIKLYMQFEAFFR